MAALGISVEDIGPIERYLNSGIGCVAAPGVAVEVLAQCLPVTAPCFGVDGLGPVPAAVLVPGVGIEAPARYYGVPVVPSHWSAR